MIILLIVLIILLLLIFYLFILSMRRINRYEEVLIEIDDYIKYASEKLKLVDNNGSFESDDEIGFVFEELKLIQNQLDEIFSRESEKPEVSVDEGESNREKDIEKK